VLPDESESLGRKKGGKLFVLIKMSSDEFKLEETTAEYHQGNHKRKAMVT